MDNPLSDHDSAPSPPPVGPNRRELMLGSPAVLWVLLPNHDRPEVPPPTDTLAPIFDTWESE